MLRSVLVVLGSFVAMALVVVVTTALSARLLLGRGAPGARPRLTPAYLGVTLCFAALAALLGGWLAAHYAAGAPQAHVICPRRAHGRDESGLDATVHRRRSAAVVRAGAARPHAAGRAARRPAGDAVHLNPPARSHSPHASCAALAAEPGIRARRPRAPGRGDAVCPVRTDRPPEPRGAARHHPHSRRTPRPSPRAAGWRGCTAAAAVTPRHWRGNTSRTTSSSGASWRRTSPRPPSSTPTPSWCGSSGGACGPTAGRCWPCPRRCSRRSPTPTSGRIIAYIRSLPPVPGLPAKHHAGSDGLARPGDAQYSARRRCWWPRADSITASGYYPAGGEANADGAYLARTSCSECHGLTLNGDFGPDLRIAAGYTPEQFAHFFKTGEALGGRETQMMSKVARNRFSRLTDAEVAAIYSYLVARAATPPDSTDAVTVRSASFLAGGVLGPPRLGARTSGVRPGHLGRCRGRAVHRPAGRVGCCIHDSRPPPAGAAGWWPSLSLYLGATLFAACGGGDRRPDGQRLPWGPRGGPAGRPRDLVGGHPAGFWIALWPLAWLTHIVLAWIDDLSPGRSAP